MGLFDKLFHRNTKKTNQQEISRSQSKNGTPKISIPRGHIEIITCTLDADTCDALSSSFIAIDTETTGLQADYDVIIEIGSVRFNNGIATESYGTLINSGVPVPPSASSVNHISTQMLQQYGIPPQQAFSEFTRFLGDALGGNTFLCAHNASFDMGFLKNALEQYGYSGTIKCIDTLAASRKLIKGVENYRQESIANYFGVNNIQAHRAVSDAEVCGRILLGLIPLERNKLEKDKELYGGKELSDEEWETAALLFQSMLYNNCDIERFRLYKNSAGYVDVIDVYTVLKFKLAKTKSYVVIPRKYKDSVSNWEECSKGEGDQNIRLIFDTPLELEQYGELFAAIYYDFQKAESTIMKDYEADFFSLAYLNRLPLEEISTRVNSAQNRQALKIEQEKIKAAEIEAKKAADAKKKYEAKAQKEEKEKELAERKKERELQKALLNQQISEMRKKSIVYSYDEIKRIARLSADQGKRSVLQMDDEGHVLNVYLSISEASQAACISPKTIRDVANGKYKHGGGFRWKYADEFEE